MPLSRRLLPSVRLKHLADTIGLMVIYFENCLRNGLFLPLDVIAGGRIELKA
jgi:hypothetical protein